MADNPSEKNDARRLSPMAIAGIVLAVAAVIAVIAGVALAQRQSGVVKPGQGGAHAGSGEGTAAVGAGATGGTQGQPGVKPGSGSSAASGGAGSPGPRTIAPRPTEPAKTGSKVTTISAPPEGTVGMLVVPAEFTTARYSITFRPYGWGPGGAQGGRLVIRIDSSKPLDAAAKALAKEFAGRNAVVWVQGPVAKTVVLGGTYTGTMAIRKAQGDVGALYLLEAAPKK